jgi:hypothetical protein
LWLVAEAREQILKDNFMAWKKEFEAALFELEAEEKKRPGL